MEKEFLDSLTELFDTKQAIEMDTRLEDIEEWDSLSFVSFAAMVNIKYDKELAVEDLEQAKTIYDLYMLVTNGK